MHISTFLFPRVDCLRDGSGHGWLVPVIQADSLPFIWFH